MTFAAQIGDRKTAVRAGTSALGLGLPHLRVLEGSEAVAKG